MDNYFEQVDINLRRMKLATHVLAEIQTQLLDPLYPEPKADLLLASEDLAETAFEILEAVREIVWKSNITGPTSIS